MKTHEMYRDGDGQRRPLHDAAHCEREARAAMAANAWEIAAAWLNSAADASTTWNQRENYRRAARLAAVVAVSTPRRMHA